jgi:hypothetical protein
MAGRSRKSRARSASRREDLVFVIDECLGGTQVRDALVNAGAQVKLVKEEFGEGAPDLEWLPEVGQRGWVVLTKDKRIRRNKAEKEAFVAARVRAFFVTAKDLTGPQRAELLVAMLPRLTKLATQYEAPFIAVVRRDRVEMYDGLDYPAVRKAAKKRSR